MRCDWTIWRGPECGASAAHKGESRVALQRGIFGRRGRRTIGDKGPQLTQFRNSSNSTLWPLCCVLSPRPSSLPFLQQPFQQPRTNPPPNRCDGGAIRACELCCSRGSNSASQRRRPR
ncbi:hypothetical protein M758_UG299900 [Ceratodon purpureus]|nr:hypothetical protein M758_UG299900 [Ceratodon purpureus]